MRRIEKLLYVLTEKLLRKLCFGSSDQGLLRRTAYGNLYIQRFSIVNKNIFKIEAKFEQSSRLEHCGIDSLLEVRPSGHWELSYNFKDKNCQEIIQDIKQKLSDAITGTNNGIRPDLKSKLLSNDLNIDSEYNEGLNEILNIFNQG